MIFPATLTRNWDECYSTFCIAFSHYKFLCWRPILIEVYWGFVSLLQSCMIVICSVRSSRKDDWPSPTLASRAWCCPLTFTRTTKRQLQANNSLAAWSFTVMLVCKVVDIVTIVCAQILKVPSFLSIETLLSRCIQSYLIKWQSLERESIIRKKLVRGQAGILYANSSDLGWIWSERKIWSNRANLLNQGQLYTVSHSAWPFKLWSSDYELHMNITSLILSPCRRWFKSQNLRQLRMMCIHLSQMQRVNQLLFINSLKHSSWPTWHHLNLQQSISITNRFFCKPRMATLIRSFKRSESLYDCMILYCWWILVKNHELNDTRQRCAFCNCQHLRHCQTLCQGLSSWYRPFFVVSLSDSCIRAHWAWFWAIDCKQLKIVLHCFPKLTNGERLLPRIVKSLNKDYSPNLALLVWSSVNLTSWLVFKANTSVLLHCMWWESNAATLNTITSTWDNFGRENNIAIIVRACVTTPCP